MKPTPIEAMIMLGLAPILVISALYMIDRFIGWLRGEND